jgi:dTDP-4-dehydrorhamnose 3,5-epimerase
VAGSKEGNSVDVAPLAVPGSYLITPPVHHDDRGGFAEWYRHDTLAHVVGHSLPVAQANWSTSRAGTIRGLHFADVPPGQAKYVSCTHGRILDVVVDLRIGSPTFGTHDAIELDASRRCAVYLAEGLGHAFCALDDATVIYLCSTTYSPAAEHGINPLDPALALPWPTSPKPLLSPKDAEAPSLAEAVDTGMLPRYDDCSRLHVDPRASGTASRASASIEVRQ